MVLAVPKESQINSSTTDHARHHDRDGRSRVPVGSYTREVLDSFPPGQRKAIYDNVRSEEPDVGGIVGKLTQGAVDAGFVYITDVTRQRRTAEGDRAAG